MVTICKPVSYTDDVHGIVVFAGYHHAKYGGLDIIVNKDGLINLNKICQLYVDKNGKHSKTYADWLKDDEGEKWIKFLRGIHAEEGGDSNKFLVEVTGPDCISGTYGIEYLAQKVASWISPVFDWNMCRIMENHIKEQSDTV